MYIPPFNASVTKTNIVSTSIITQGLFLDRSFRSVETEDFSTCAGTTLSLVVRNVMIKNIIPAMAKKNITFSNPAALSPCPNDNANGNNKDCIIN